jgi:hypothetical protein
MRLIPSISLIRLRRPNSRPLGDASRQGARVNTATFDLNPGLRALPLDAELGCLAVAQTLVRPGRSRIGWHLLGEVDYSSVDGKGPDRQATGPFLVGFWFVWLLWRLSATTGLARFARLFLYPAVLTALFELFLGDLAVVIGVDHFEVDDKRRRLVRR